MKVSVIEIILILKDVLLYGLEIEKPHGWTTEWSHRWHSNRQIDPQLDPHSYSCLAGIAAYNVDVRWLGVGQCVSCVVCGPGLGERDWDFVVLILLALRFGDLYGSQALDGLNGINGKISYRLWITIGDTLYNIFEPAKRIFRLDHASLIIRSHLCKELIRFQLE